MFYHGNNNVSILVDQGIAIIKALDQITGSIEENSYNVLRDQSSIWDEIITEWEKENPTDVPSELGCNNRMTDNMFAIYAAHSLEERFHFLKFFVAVFRYNERLVEFIQVGTNISETSKCKNDKMRVFKYSKTFPAKEIIENKKYFFHKREKLFVISTYMPKNITAKDKCLSENIELNCNEWSKFGTLKLENGAICFMQHFKYLCGNSWANFPFSVKACLIKERPLLLGSCF